MKNNIQLDCTEVIFVQGDQNFETSLWLNISRKHIVRLSIPLWVSTGWEGKSQKSTKDDCAFYDKVNKIDFIQYNF